MTELLVLLSFGVIMAAPLTIMLFDSACAYFWPNQNEENTGVCCVGKEEDCE